jgi:hypothetical protein
MSDTVSSHSQPFYTRFIPKLGNYLAGITLLCYLTGFAITNMYLGSLGIVYMDILRARYIMAGLLFLLFLGAISYLVYGLLQTLGKRQYKSALTLIAEVLQYSLQNLGVICIAIPAVAVFAGSFGDGPDRVSVSPPALAWTDWFATKSANWVKSTAILYGVMWLSVLFMLGIFVTINPRDKQGTRTRRKQILREIFDGIKQKKKLVFGFVVGAFFFLLAMSFLFSLIDFVVTGRASHQSFADPVLSQEPWLRYFGMIAIVYTLVAVYLTFLFLFSPDCEKESNEPAKSDPIERASGWIFLIRTIIIIVVPLYVFGVYPCLPQQIGGGRTLRVELTTSNEELNLYFADPETETYLVDRASDSLLLIVSNEAGQDHHIMEVASPLIQSIIYNPLD